MRPEYLLAATVFVAPIVGVVVVVALVIPSTRAVILNWIARRGALSDEAHSELSQLRDEIALLRNQIAELQQQRSGGIAISAGAAHDRLPGGP